MFRQGDFFSVFFDEAHALFQMPPRGTGVEAALRAPFTQVRRNGSSIELYD